LNERKQKATKKKTNAFLSGDIGEKCRREE